MSRDTFLYFASCILKHFQIKRFLEMITRRLQICTTEILRAAVSIDIRIRFPKLTTAKHSTIAIGFSSGTVQIAQVFSERTEVFIL